MIISPSLEGKIVILVTFWGRIVEVEGKAYILCLERLVLCPKSYILLGHIGADCPEGVYSGSDHGNQSH